MVLKVFSLVMLISLALAEKDHSDDLAYQLVLEKINKEGILAIPVAQNTNAIYVNASYVGNSFDDEHFQLLEPIAEQINQDKA